ncbi:MAG: hypothetical protein HC932_00025 [Thermales bacterium]|nr:hypothetical protein [Thermales bacterium]
MDITNLNIPNGDEPVRKTVVIKKRVSGQVKIQALMEDITENQLMEKAVEEYLENHKLG